MLFFYSDNYKLQDSQLEGISRRVALNVNSFHNFQNWQLTGVYSSC